MSLEKSQGVYEQVGVAMTCRSYQEYMDMFSLTTELLGRGPILDVGAGASSFTAGASRLGYMATAVDPLYEMDSQEIYARGKHEIIESTEKLARIASTLRWDYYGSLDKHQQNREASLEHFIQAFRADETKERYVSALLPDLPFANDTFSLVIGSHFLFLYHQQFDQSFHINALTELVRVCAPGGQIRLYPTVGLDQQPYPHMEALMDRMEHLGCEASLMPTSFRFLQGAEHFLQISK